MAQEGISSELTINVTKPGRLRAAPDEENEPFMSDLAPIAEAVALDPLVSHPKDFHVFHQFLERCKDLPAITTAVVWPLSEVALKGAVEAAAEGLIEPTLIGDERLIRALAARTGTIIAGYPILHAESETEAAEL